MTITTRSNTEGYMISVEISSNDVDHSTSETTIMKLIVLKEDKTKAITEIQRLISEAISTLEDVDLNLI